MKSFLTPAVLMAMLVVAGTASAQMQMKQDSKKMTGEVTITGEIIDVKCFITSMQGGRGAEHEDCAVACIKGGLPVGILDDKTGDVYILAPQRGMKGANEALLPYVAKKVTVKGKASEKGGTTVLLYSSVETAM